MPEIDSLAHLFGTTVQYDPTTEMEDVCTAPICASYPVTSPLLSPDASSLAFCALLLALAAKIRQNMHGSTISRLFLLNTSAFLNSPVVS
jgi:hypothetical protein